MARRRGPQIQCARAQARSPDPAPAAAQRDQFARICILAKQHCPDGVPGERGTFGLFRPALAARPASSFMPLVDQSRAVFFAGQARGLRYWFFRSDPIIVIIDRIAMEGVGLNYHNRTWQYSFYSKIIRCFIISRYIHFNAFRYMHMCRYIMKSRHLKMLKRLKI
jgi:hypothetical protein